MDQNNNEDKIKVQRKASTKKNKAGSSSSTRKNKVVRGQIRKREELSITNDSSTVDSLGKLFGLLSTGDEEGRKAYQLPPPEIPSDWKELIEKYSPKLEKRESGIHGYGVYTRCVIPYAAAIIEYMGEKITSQQMERRLRYEQRINKAPNNLNYFFRLTKRKVIDASDDKQSNLAKYINHSCEPNVEYVTLVNGKDPWRIIAVALRRIKKGEELKVDYRMSQESSKDEPVPCLCGSDKCKKFL